MVFSILDMVTSVEGNFKADTYVTSVDLLISFSYITDWAEASEAYF